jgi:hypothetical protein
MMIANWRLNTQDELMWNSAAIGNYSCGLQVFPSDDKTKIGINFLQSLIATWDLFRDKIILRVQMNN